MFMLIEPKTINDEMPPGKYELIDINNAFKGSVELKLDEKIMKTFLTTHHEIIFNSELNEVFGFVKKKYPAGTHSSGRPANITTFDKVHSKRTFVDGSTLSGRRESILFSFSFSAPLGC